MCQGCTGARQSWCWLSDLTCWLDGLAGLGSLLQCPLCLGPGLLTCTRALPASVHRGSILPEGARQGVTSPPLASLPLIQHLPPPQGRRFSRPPRLNSYCQWVEQYAGDAEHQGPQVAGSWLPRESGDDKLLDTIMLRLRLADGLDLRQLAAQHVQVGAGCAGGAVQFGRLDLSQRTETACTRGCWVGATGRRGGRKATSHFLIVWLPSASFGHA